MRKPSRTCFERPEVSSSAKWDGGIAERLSLGLATERDGCRVLANPCELRPKTIAPGDQYVRIHSGFPRGASSNSLQTSNSGFFGRSMRKDRAARRDACVMVS